MDARHFPFYYLFCSFEIKITTFDRLGLKKDASFFRKRVFYNSAPLYKRETESVK